MENSSEQRPDIAPDGAAEIDRRRDAAHGGTVIAGQHQGIGELPQHRHVRPLPHRATAPETAERHALRSAGICVHGVDAGSMARELRNPRLVNTVMLGAAAAFLPFPPEDLESLVVGRFTVRKPALAAANRRAFAAGRLAAQGMQAGA